MARKEGKLFTAIVKVLLLAALVPVIVFGVYMIDMDNRTLKNEMLDKQYAINTTVESLVRSYLAKKTGSLRHFVDFHNNVHLHGKITKEDLKYFAELYPDTVSVAVLDKKGNKIIEEGNLDLSRGRNGELNAILYITLGKGESYIGVIRNVDGKKTIVIAYPMYEKKQVTGALVTRVEISELIDTINENFLEKENLFMAIFASDGEPIVSSGAVTDDVKDAFTKMEGKTNGEFKFSDGKKYLVTTSMIISTGWSVYIQQPSKVWGGSITENHLSVIIIAFMGIGVIVFVLVLSKIVIKPIVQPVKILQDAAAQVVRGNYDFLPKLENMPANEIGDLGRVFVSMAKALKLRKEIVAKAEKELADINIALENKVAERTKELDEATKELVKNERLAAIGEMASIISHEIRNPLAVITNSTQLIKMIVNKEADEENPKLQKQFKIIEAEVKQANRIIEEVLGYARNRKQIVSTVDLNSYVKEILAVQPVPPNITLIEDFAPQSAKISIDVEEMKQALRNLIVNAMDVMQNGGTLRVSTRVKPGKRVVGVYVADEGTGMGEETLMKIFTPFFTTKARGTGLGLAVVKKAVTNNKGKLYVESVKDVGTTFKIYLKSVKNG
ncbi:signal transduction histidine kinase [Elusimicrobium posterum]|uniref:ATP-binding protein n=1 Tax=Elusimicrobium posterum TaxID=3116653 RepID=UPI003C78B746